MSLLGGRKQKPRRSLSEQEAANKVISYQEKRFNLRNTGRYQKSKVRSAAERRLAASRVSLGFAGLVLVSLLGYMLWFGGRPQVQLHQSANVGYRSIENYQSGIAHMWSDTFMNKTKITASTSRFKAKILEAYPEIESVEVHVPLLGTSPVITLKPAVSSLMIVNNQGDLLLVGSSGKALIDLRNAEFTGNNQTIPNIIDETGLELDPGKYALTSEQVSFLVGLHSALLEAKLPVKEIALPAVPNQVNVSLNNKPYYLKFNFLGDPITGVGAYLAFEKELSRTGAPKPKQYVDLRVAEKVFYK